MGIGPNAYLKLRRLHCVRADLERADSRVTSISMAALQWGFWHFGHFTHDYVNLFGEKPSDTLRRQRPPHVVEPEPKDAAQFERAGPAADVLAARARPAIFQH
jgi:AraC-like DNA-binding protein